MATLGEAARTQFLLVVAGVACVLLVAATVSRVLRARDSAGVLAATLANVDARIRAWWVMIALFAAAVLLGAWAVTLLFALVSLLALREFASHAPQAIRDRALDVACHALVVLQYAAVALAGPRAVAFALPIAATVTLPIVAIAAGGTRALQSRLAHRCLWLAVAGYCLSHVAALARLDIPGSESGGLLLVAWLVIVVQGSDVLQYVFGKTLGRRPIAPVLSPDKTVEGFAGGVLAASAIGLGLAWMTPFGAAGAFAVALLATLLGFAGGLVLSGIKREFGIKDWGETIAGHGGALDRVDSLVLPAPALYGLVRALGAS